MPTTPPISAIDICNLAIDQIGESFISSIVSPKQAAEQIMARWYDQVRRTVLREYVWGFAGKIAKLAPTTGVETADWSTAYVLPQDCVRLNLIGESRWQKNNCFELMGRHILCNEPTELWIRYNADIVDPTLMDPLFINILSLRLALKIAYKFTKKASIPKMLSEQLAQEEGKAVTVDGQEHPPIRIQRSKYLAARRMVGAQNASSVLTPLDWD